MDEKKIDRSLTEVIDKVDEKLLDMNIEEKKEFLDYLKSSIEDMMIDVEHDLNRFYNYR